MKKTYTSNFEVKQKTSRGMSWQEINLLSWQEINLLDWFSIVRKTLYIMEIVSNFITNKEYDTTFEKEKDFTVRW